MRVESSITSISWIPSEAIAGVTKLPFELGVGHYDDAPPDQIDPVALETMRDADRFRFANHLSAWIDVEDERVARWGQSGGGVLNNTHMKIGPIGLTFKALGFPDLHPEPEVANDAVTFRQTAGGRPGMPAPRLVRGGRPQIVAPTVWTTLELTLRATGASEAKLAGATSFPRHWVYDGSGAVIQKTSTIDFKDWYTRAAGHTRTPWGDEDSPVVVSMAETALERELSALLMQGARHKIRILEPGDLLTEQGDPDTSLHVVLDGVVAVEVNDEEIAELGPGVVVGERAVLEGGLRTATLRAVTRVKVATASADAIDRRLLEALTKHHRRENG